ncbi:MAG: putative DNA binding domain-containing protein [Methanothrix sp.]|nr:putative DNA binding domain-containing protein [Methanothrix sp.]
MSLKELKASVALGEDSRRQFKQNVTNADSLAAEMAAFANSEGGTIFLGVADDGTLPGLDKADVARLNQLISLDKPYFDRNGVIWLKSGADKRRVNSKEELRRLFQFSDQFHADQLPTRAGIDKLDKMRFRDFLRDAYNLDYPKSKQELLRLLQNMSLATDEGMLNLAGVLLFAERPEWIKPLFIVKAIRYPGNVIHSTEYLDTEDFSGSLCKIYDDSLAFIMRNLRKVQSGQGVNAPGLPEIPPSVFEELLVNALIHRDYLVNATIRLFIYQKPDPRVLRGQRPAALQRIGVRN